MRFTVIDIGSNTAKAEIYKYKNKKLQLCEKYIKRDMIADHKDGGVLDSDGINVLVNIMKDFRDICAKKGVDRVFPYATQSLRGISNADEVRAIIKEKTGLDVRIITGEEEARLCYESFSATHKATDCMISDMGGGSTEISVISGGEPAGAVSLPFGSRSLTHALGIGVMPDEDQEKAIRETVAGHVNNAGIKNPGRVLFACGGTSTGMFRLYNEINGKKEKKIKTEELIRFYEKCKSDPAFAEEKAREILPERYDTVYTGLYAHICIARLTGCETVSGCKSSCRKGYAAKLIRDGRIE
ncbi:MAG: hypothetical protein J5879_04340 [Clostridia bacterium]|nr:hypothetical protein [Clostridia bacterium]